VLADALVAHLAPIRTEMNHLLQDPGALDAALRRGAEKADAIAAPILARTMDIMGFLPRR
ncbi:MAG: tryptophan--tRNA ligase, partial [Alphaproteobacteria bacterium]|nr:tryptophan--tRNA ligase [Alphaproteobacteria bacterium]